jgi:hypothetical protein
MKTKSISSLVLALSLLVTFMACENTDPVSVKRDILPERFKVDIPNSLVSSNTLGRAGGRSKEDTLVGNDVYLNLATFIYVGEQASEFVNEFLGGIRQYNIDRVLSFTYISEDDNRVKNISVESNVSYEGQLWDYLLTITDVEAVSQPDGGKALQLFWNKEAPIKGIAIVKLYNADRVAHADAPEAVFRINYEEDGERGYDAQMEVLISGLPLANPLFFTGTQAFNWAFVASGNETKEIGVAEVGLPLSSVNSSDRETLLKANSIRQVFQQEITAAWPHIDQELLAAYLSHTAAPGYFGKAGFIQGGESPGADWTSLAARIENLTPFNPAEVSALNITFK